MKNAFICSLLLSLLSLSCITYFSGSSDHENAKIAGTVVDPDGYPVPDTRVWLMNSDYNHCASNSASYRVTATDKHGRFSFDSLPPGDYTVSGRLFSHPKAFAKRSITIDSSDTIINTYTLNNTATLILDRDSFNLDSTMYIVFPGLPISEKLDKKSTKISFIPPGVLRIRGYDPATNSEIILNSNFEEILINPGDILMLSSKSPGFETPQVDTLKNFYGVVNQVYYFGLVKQFTNPNKNYFYQFYWDDNTISEWSSTPEAWHIWKEPGIYSIQAQVRIADTLFGWSDPLIAVIKK